VPDVTRLRELLGRVPETPLEVTIRSIVDWLQAEGTSPQSAPTLAGAASASDA